jgi:2-iminobutanoate/2-iminopropanoate deaminase
MQSISADDAPKAIGPYSQAVRAGAMVFLSGQIPLNPRTGEMVTVDIAKETEQVLDNLGAVLRAAGLGFEHVVRTTIYLVEMADFPTVNEAYAKRFKGVFPARATIQVAGLPKGARVEIDAIAVAPG